MKNYKQTAWLVALVLLLTALAFPAIAARGPHYGDYTTEGQVQLSDGSGNWLTMLVGSLAADWTFTFPTTNGTAGQILATDGAGVTTWSSVAGFGVTTFADTTIPYASATDTFAFDATNFNWVDTANSQALTLGAGTGGGTLTLLEGSGGGTDTVSITAPATLAADIEFILPNTAIADTGILYASAANTLAHDETNFNWLDTANSNVLTLGAGTAGGALALLEGSAGGTDAFTWTAPAALTGAYELEVPDGDGAAGQVMITDGSEVLTWAEKFNQLATNTTASVIEGDAALTAFTFTGDGDLTWDAGYFNAGQTSKVLMAGYIKSDDTGTETIDLTFKIASTEFFGSGALALAVEEEAGSPWIFECEIVGTGTDTQYAVGTFSYMFNATTSATVIPFHKTLTETTASALLFSATAEWANGAVTNDQATMTIANVSGIDFD